GLWGFVSQGIDPTQGIADELLNRTRAAMRVALKDIEAAQLFQEIYQEPEQARQVLQAHLQAATPKLASSEGWRHLVAALPASPAGAALKDLIHQIQPDVPATLLDSEGDVMLCCEAAHLPLQQLAAGVI